MKYKKKQWTAEEILCHQLDERLQFKNKDDTKCRDRQINKA